MNLDNKNRLYFWRSLHSVHTQNPMQSISTAYWFLTRRPIVSRAKTLRLLRKDPGSWHRPLFFVRAQYTEDFCPFHGKNICYNFFFYCRMFSTKRNHDFYSFSLFVSSGSPPKLQFIGMYWPGVAAIVAQDRYSYYCCCCCCCTLVAVLPGSG